MKYYAFVLIAIISLFCITGCNDSGILKTITVSEPDLSSFTNGVYRGSYRLNLPFGYFVGQSYAIADVSVSNNRFQAIHLVNIPEWLSTNANTRIPQMLNQILEEQKLNVDTVSGASFTKKAIVKAIENAFTKK